MEQTLLLLFGLVTAFLVGLFTSKKQNQEDAKVIDLTSKIKQNKEIAAKQQEDADQKTKEYLDALKKYDPNFHDDDGDGKPSA